MHNRNHIILATSCLFTMLTACSSLVGPQESGIKTPTRWTGLADLPQDAPLTIDAKAKVERNWWKHFGDPTLDALITEALKNNKSLAIAKARVEEARADRNGIRSLLYPQVSLAADASRGDQGLLTEDKTLSISDVDLEASWEVDLFGKNQALASEANAILQSEEATQQAVTAGLLAEVALNYFDLRNDERQIAITRQNLESQKKTLELTQAQFKGAFASDFDVQRAGAQVSTTESELPALQIAYDTALNSMNVLLGHAPGDEDALIKTEEPLKPLDQQIVVSAPSTVLATRPDVLAAERHFAASISAHTAASKQLFPTINLLALFGVQNIGNVSTTVWNIGGNLVQPILNFGGIRSQIDAANAQEQQAFFAYQQTVLKALEDMENALSNYLHETDRNASLAKAVEQNRKGAELARLQFTNGYNGLLDVLVVERNTLDAESSLAASDAKLRKDLVNIYTAAGGGWNEAPVNSSDAAKQ